MNDSAAAAALIDPLRLAALRQTVLLDTAPEAAFDRFTRLASTLIKAPISLISLVDDHRQFFKSSIGLPEAWLDAGQTALAYAMCRHTVDSRAPLLVEDASRDLRFRDHPAVGGLGVVAYAGVPLLTATGHVLGSFCVIDTEPRAWREDELTILRDLAALVMTELERRQTVVELQEAKRQLERLTDALPVQIAYIDATERYRFVNAAYPKRLGRPIGQILNHTVREVLGEPVYAAIAPYIRKVLAGEAQRFELPVEHLGASTDVSYMPQRDHSGRVVGFYVLVIDITARRAFERTAQQTMERVDLALQAGHMGIWEWHIPTGKVIWSDELYRIFGVEKAAGEDTEPPDFFDLVHPEDRAHVAALITDQIAQRSGNRYECRINKPNGETRWILSRSLYRSDATQGDRVYGLCVDITERKQGELSQQLLLEELNHRVRNTLAIVTSIAGQTLKHSRSLDSFRDAFIGRIQALGDAHTLLSNNRWQPSSMAALIEHQLVPYARGRKGAFVASGPEILMTPKPALTLSLVIHELAANAAKYGGLSTDAGGIEITWSVLQDQGRRQLRLMWRERGGPPIQPPERTGFGSQLIDFNIAHEFGGTVQTTYQVSGVLHELTIPLPPSGNRL